MAQDSINPSFALSRAMFSNVPYTIVKQEGSSKTSPQWNISTEESIEIQVKNIILKQNPSEVLDLKMNFERTNPSHDEYQNLYKVTYMKMTFQNHLHDFDTNYVYEVACKRSCSNPPDQYLFSFLRQRYDKTIIEEETYFPSCFTLDTKNLYVVIRRLHQDNYRNSKQYIEDYSVLQELPTDITLVVGSARFYAHQVVLEYYSDVFKQMFKTKSTYGILHIEQFKPEVIREMIHFLYTGRIECVKMRYELLKVAHVYQLHDLYQLCIEYIFIFSNFKNIAHTLIIADLCDKSLKEKALKFVENHKEEMNKEPSYLTYLNQTS